jgi:hypothetical protein
MWGPTLANAGAYEIAEDLLTIRPIIARIPVGLIVADPPGGAPSKD